MEIKKEEEKYYEKKRRKELKLESLQEKRKSLEKDKAYRDEVTKEKQKIKELKGQPFYEKVGSGVVVGIKKGFGAMKKEAPRINKATDSLFGRGKTGMPSLLGSQGLRVGMSEGYFKTGKTPSYFMGEKEYAGRLGGLFKEPAREKLTEEKKKHKKHKKKIAYHYIKVRG